MMLSPRHSKLPPLDPQSLRELATMLDSGISITQAWALSSANQHPAFPGVLRQLEMGSGFASSLQNLDLISPSQRVYIAASESAGCLDKAVLQLASDTEAKDAQSRKISSRFYVVYFLLFVGWSVSLVNAMSANQDLFYSFVRNSFVVLIFYLAIQLVKRYSLAGSWWWLTRAWRLNLKASKPYQWAFISNWYNLLNTQLSAGVDPVSAIAQMKGLIQSRSYNRSVSRACNDVRDGLSLSQALSQNGLLPSVEFHTILATAEASGRLSEALDHQVKIATQRFELFKHNVNFWIPKILYAICAAGALSMAL